MKKKFIFFTMLLLTLMGGVKLNVLNAQETVVEIGDGTINSLYAPTADNSAKYSVSQQLYLKEEINKESGSITKISFQHKYGNNNSRNIVVYMRNVDKESYSSASDWVEVLDEDIVYEGSHTFGTNDTWTTIELQTPFVYTGGDICITINDKTGVAIGSSGYDSFYSTLTGEYQRGIYATRSAAGSVAIDCSDLSGIFSYQLMTSSFTTPSNAFYVNNIRLTIEPLTPSVKIAPESIDLGAVRLGEDFFTEKPFDYNNYAVTVKAQGGATISNITTDNDFFRIVEVYTSGQDEYIFHINYNRNAEAGSKDGNLVVTYDTDKTATISLSADAYSSATEGEAIENPIVVAFTDNAFTHAATDMHDDYILPGEENDGNNGDAVYKFTLENDAVLTANVTGTKPIVAIYNEFGDNEGPSSDNNYEGISNEPAAPSAPTTFFYDFEDGSLEDFILIEKDDEKAGYSNHLKNWEILEGEGVDKSTCIHSQSYSSNPKIDNANNYIVTKSKYSINSTSKLIFDARNSSNYDPDYLYIEVSTDGENFTQLGEKVALGNAEYANIVFDLGTKLEAAGLAYGEYHIALHHNEHYHMFARVDNLQLTDGSAKSRSVAQARSTKQIDRVLYPADTYYLVAAADGNFTLTLSTESLPAPEAATLTAPANEATEQDNPFLTWTLDKFAEEYQLLLGTTNPPTDVVVNWSAPATSYQTEGLANNTVYYWQVKSRNSVGETSSEVFYFVTPLNKPTNVTAYETNLYPGDETTISWEEAVYATSYNVYVGETKVASEVTETSYTLSGLEYNVNPGHNVTVTANHTLGESAKSDAVVVKMTAKSTVTFTVKNAAGTPVEGASVRIYDGKDQYGVAIAEQTFTTNADGQVVEDLLYLYGDYTGYYNFEVTKAPYITYNYTSSGINDYINYSNLNNPTYAKNITLQLSAPTISITDNTLYPGETLEVTWDDIDGAENYTIYIEDEEIEVIEKSPYTLVVDNTDYNMNNHYNYGDYIEVKANYGALGSSARSGSYYKVTGYNDITGTITNGAGATLRFTGTDEFGAEQTFTTTVGDDDKYTMENVLAGTYTVTASKFDYQDLSKELKVIHAITLTFDSEMTACPAADASLLSNVTVTEVGENAQITWTGDENDTHMYDIYRKNVDTKEVQLVAEDQNDAYGYGVNKSYIYTDEAYLGLPDGTYQYGVRTMIEEPVNVLNEGFEGGSVPASWTKTGSFATTGLDANSGSYSVYYYSQYSNYTYNLTSPQIDLTESTTSTLSFYYKNLKGAYYANSIRVKVKDVEAGTTSSSLKTISTATNAFTECTIDLKNYVGKKIQVMFEIYTYQYSTTYFDDIVVSSTVPTNSSTVWSNTIKKGGIVFTNNDGAGDGKWETAENWKNGNAPTLNDGTEEVTIKASATISSDVNVKYLAISGGAYLTVNKDATLTVTGELVNNDEYGLTINDGAQVFHNSENVKARFAMDIVAPNTWSSENTDGWQFIAAPFVNNTASIANFTSPYPSTTDYDLYKYNGVNAGEEWDNQKDNQGNWGYYFENGVGYLASYPEERTAYLSGTLNNASSHTWNFTYNNDEQPLANFHLLGNPFSFDMNMNNATFTNMVQGVAIVTAQGGYNYEVTSIPVGDGFFVKATGENPSFSYNAASKATRGEKANSLNVIATSNAGNDNVVINFAGEQEGFPKMRNFNDAIATVYVQDKGANYGIYNCDENTTEVELCFNANQMGNYTISIEPNGKFQTVTLVDRFTGIETNMLLEDYSFTAMSDVNNNRFILKMVNGQQTTDNSHFVFQSGEDLIIEAEGTVQIIDVMGRVVYNNDVTSDNNRINVSDFNNGAYVVRVINESEIKVEKVVIY